MARSASFSLACPRCHTLLEQPAPDELCCPADGLRFKRLEGIWRMLLPEREPVFEKFSRDYETIRRLEGRGSAGPAYYRALPYRDLSERMSADWRIRATSFNALLKNVVQPFTKRLGNSPRVLDLGAGNGWLSNRLAQRGYTVAAVDLTVNGFDGLGCYRHYESLFTPVQAEFDHLPFSERTADLVIFNAAFHYAVDYADTLRESLRVLAPGGEIVVLDSPVYHDAASGALMVRERESQFVKQYGFPSNALPSENFLTYQRLADLASGQLLRLQIITPYYGLSWLFRPLKARFLRQREPARFHLIVFSR